MILDVADLTKAFGAKELFGRLSFSLNASEKVGLIGRNGSGKSSLLKIIDGQDDNFGGSVSRKKGLVMVSSRQEHEGYENLSVIGYIANDLPDFSRLKKIIDEHPAKMTGRTKLMQEYSEALERFGQLGYFEIERDIEVALAKYQVDADKVRGTLGHLSGGQKRMVELVKVQLAKVDLALIDEPTNHMDYVAKAEFIKWLKIAKQAVLVVSHDRDVLRSVDRIIEIRDGKADIFNGNYDDYLRVNAVRMSGQINEHEVTQSRINNLKDKVIQYKRMKEKARDPGTIARFKRLQNKAETELADLMLVEKPSIWIDQNSSKYLSPKLTNAYHKHKARNIKVNLDKSAQRSSRKLLSVDDLGLGYERQLFSGISFQLSQGDRLEIKGRNGVGKSTLVKAIIDTTNNSSLGSVVYSGTIEIDDAVRLGVYQQEFAASEPDLSLYQAVEKAYLSQGLSPTEQTIRQKLSEYLFSQDTDVNLPVSRLSGGQRARLQLISMLAANPNLLILDEPTNHLDLPSIEELEQALLNYSGAIIYISHDSYFSGALGGEVIIIGD